MAANFRQLPGEVTVGRGQKKTEAEELLGKCVVSGKTEITQRVLHRARERMPQLKMPSLKGHNPPEQLT